MHSVAKFGSDERVFAPLVLTEVCDGAGMRIYRLTHTLPGRLKAAGGGGVYAREQSGAGVDLQRRVCTGSVWEVGVWVLVLYMLMLLDVVCTGLPAMR